MSRLIAYFGNEPDRMACGLYPARTALYARATPSTPIQGVGLGFVQGDNVLLQKHTRSRDREVDLFDQVKDLHADALVARVGLGSDGVTDAKDADPFRFRTWLMGSLGPVEGFAAAREELLGHIPDFLRRNIRGGSASEHMFHLLLAFLHDAGLLDQLSPEPDAVRLALAGSLTFLDRLGADHGAAPSRPAIAVSNGRMLLATSRGVPVRYLTVTGIPDCELCHGRLDRAGSDRRIAHKSLRAVVVEIDDAAGGDRPGWATIPPGATLLVGADRAPQVVAG